MWLNVLNLHEYENYVICAILKFKKLALTQKETAAWWKKSLDSNPKHNAAIAARNNLLIFLYVWLCEHMQYKQECV
jgi:hypothetical protein